MVVGCAFVPPQIVVCGANVSGMIEHSI